MTIQEAIEYLEGLGWTVKRRGGTYVIIDQDGTEYDPISKEQLIEEANDQQWIDWTEETYPWWNTAEWGLYPADETGYPVGSKEARETAQWISSQHPEKPSVDEGVALRAAIADAERRVRDALASGLTELAQTQLMPELADLRARYTQYQQGLGIGVEEEEPPFGGFTEEEADARVAQLGPGYQKYYNPNTNIFYVGVAEEPPAVEQPLPAGQSRVISEDGYDWAYDPKTGDYTALVGKTPEQPKRSLDQTIEDYLIAGDTDKAIALYTTWEHMTKPKGLTPDQAASYIMGLAVSPAEMEEWIDALTDDWSKDRTQAEIAQSPVAMDAAARNAMPAQTPIEMGGGIPADLLADTGAGGFQFPSWLTTPGGMPPTGAQTGLTPEEIEARRGIFQGQTAEPTQRTIFDPTQAALNQTYPDMDSAYRVGNEMEGRTGKKYRVVAKDGGYGLIEAPVESAGTQKTGIFGTTPQQLAWLAAENAKRQGQATGMAAGGIFGGGTTPIEQQVPGIFDSTKGVLEPVPTPVTGVVGTQQKKPFSSIPMQIYGGGAVEGLSPTLPEGGFLPPELLGDMGAQAATSGARVGAYGYSADQFVNMPPPANETEARKKAMGQPYQTVSGYTFAPTPGFKTKQQEIEESNLADQQRQIFQRPAQQQAALWRRGDVAPFERNIFERPEPLAEQTALLQAAYRKWSQQQQKGFEAKPVKRAVFR